MKKEKTLIGSLYGENLYIETKDPAIVDLVNKYFADIQKKMAELNGIEEIKFDEKYHKDFQTTVFMNQFDLGKKINEIIKVLNTLTKVEEKPHKLKVRSEEEDLRFTLNGVMKSDDSVSIYSTPTANWEVKYNSILQVLESRNDTTSKYKVIEALIDGIFCEELEEIKREIEELPIYMRFAGGKLTEQKEAVLKEDVVSLIDKRLNNK